VIGSAAPARGGPALAGPGGGTGMRIVGGSAGPDRLTCGVGGPEAASSPSTVGHDGSSGTQSSAVDYKQCHTRDQHAGEG